MIYKGDVGTVVLLDTLSDISSATQVLIRVKKPSGVCTEWSSSVDSLTKVKYVIQSGDLNESGIYKLQPKVTMPGFTGSCDIVSIQVDPLVCEVL